MNLWVSMTPGCGQWDHETSHGVCLELHEWFSSLLKRETALDTSGASLKNHLSLSAETSFVPASAWLCRYNLMGPHLDQALCFSFPVMGLVWCHNLQSPQEACSLQHNLEVWGALMPIRQTSITGRSEVINLLSFISWMDIYEDAFHQPPQCPSSLNTSPSGGHNSHPALLFPSFLFHFSYPKLPFFMRESYSLTNYGAHKSASGYVVRKAQI